jgi:hypothetical protein
MTQYTAIKQTDNSTARETSTEPFNPLQSLTTPLERIFSTTKEESRVQKARGIMGQLVSELADEELDIFITEFQYLINEYLDEYERQVFDGQTLKQVLGQE